MKRSVKSFDLIDVYVGAIICGIAVGHLVSAAWGWLVLGVIIVIAGLLKTDVRT